jgi:hypothetical protein
MSRLTVAGFLLVFVLWRNSDYDEWVSSLFFWVDTVPTGPQFTWVVGCREVTLMLVCQVSHCMSSYPVKPALSPTPCSSSFLWPANNGKATPVLSIQFPWIEMFMPVHSCQVSFKRWVKISENSACLIHGVFSTLMSLGCCCHLSYSDWRKACKKTLIY